MATFVTCTDFFFFYRLCDARRHRGSEPPAPCPMSLARRGTAFIGSWTKANPIIQPSSPHPMRLNLPRKWSGGIGRGRVDMWKSIFPYLTLRFPHVPCISLLSRKKLYAPCRFSFMNRLCTFFYLLFPNWCLPSLHQIVRSFAVFSL